MVIEEREIISSILAGDRDLYAQLVERHKRNLYQLCLAILSDPHEAEEAAQVAFIKAFRSLGSFRGASSFRTWITRIGLNHCKDLIRQKARRKFLSLDFLLEGGKPTPPVLVQEIPEEPFPLPVLSQAMLDCLSEGERAVIRLMREKEGLSYAQIGRELGLSLDGVKGRLKRARSKLQHFLKNPSSNGGPELH